ncbi:MAG: hypothetical protein M9894_23040 [Planctomycetes bacterium]|nr:hypothetical protein [Planctomycetota bacterium]
MAAHDALPDLPSPDAGVPRPGFSVTPPPAALPGFDPSNSPLAPGGRPGSPAPAPANASLFGLLHPAGADQPRVTYRVRREGWVARRSAARLRFRRVADTRDSSSERLMAGLDRRGLLARSKTKAVRPRFNLRGLL